MAKDPQQNFNDDMPSDRELLGRIDERTLALVETMAKLENRLEESYVTKSEFAPVKAIVFGGAGIVMTAVLGGLIALVVNVSK